MKGAVTRTVGADPVDLRRLSRTLEDSSVELLRIRRRVDEAATRLPQGGWTTAELAAVSRWLADGAIDARRRALTLEQQGPRARRRLGEGTPLAPWFSGDACPKALITTQLLLPGLGTKPRSQPSEHLAAGTSCQTAIAAPVPVATPNGVLLAPGSLRINTSEDTSDDDGGGRRAPSGPERRRLPRGFPTAESFAAFGRRLRAGMREAGLADTQPALQGSAVSGRSFHTGAPFDLGRTSDFDVTIASPAAMERARALGIGLRSGGTRTGPLTTAQLDQLGLGDLARQLRQDLGRKVHFMLYESIEAASARGPLIVVPVR